MQNAKCKLAILYFLAKLFRAVDLKKFKHFVSFPHIYNKIFNITVAINKMRNFRWEQQKRTKQVKKNTQFFHVIHPYKYSIYT